MVRTAYLLAALLVAETCASPPETVRGEVALTDSPLCDFFVVRTDRSFSLLDWRGGHSGFTEGDFLVGPLTTTGLHVFVLEGSGETRAQVEEVGASLPRAQLAYYSRCHETKPDAPTPGGVVARR